MKTVASVFRLRSAKLPLLGLLGGLALGPASLYAQQSLSSSGAVFYLQNSGDFYGADSNGSQTGAPVSAFNSNSFTGLDGAGNTQTMSFSGSGTASATYGQLHAYARGLVTNAYSNPANAPYISPDGVNPAGSPDGFESYGDASFTDTLQFGGALQSGYQARYIFHLDGTVTGNPDASATLRVTIGTSQTQAFTTDQNGVLSLDYTTADAPINGQVPQLITAQLDSVFLTRKGLQDGRNIAAVADLSDTLTLARVEVIDAAGNPVSGVTVTSGSGTVYPGVVPEPSTWAAMLAGLGFLALALRRRVHGR